MDYAQKLLDLDGFSAYRWWGDQFLLLNIGESSVEEVESNTRLIQQVSNVEWKFDGFDFNSTVSIGVVSYPKDGLTTKMLNQNLDISIYKAKELGKGQCILYSEELSKEVQYYTELEDELRKAIDGDMFELYCQPIYNLTTKETKSYEVLLRWFHRNSIFHNIGKVIQAAEKTEQMDDIDRWVVRTLFNKIQHTKELQDKTFTVNLSSASFKSDTFVEYLIKQVEVNKIDAGKIVLEITEHSIVSDYEATINTMLKLKEIGFRIALDDFGTMYSSLSYLAKLPLDVLKIDKSYVDGILSDGKDLQIVELIIQLGHKLDMLVISEGIEEEEQNDQLAKIGCEYGQGYFFARPMPIMDIIE